MGQGEQDIVEQGKDAADQGKDAVGQGGKDRYLFHNNHFKPTSYDLHHLITKFHPIYYHK